MIDASRVISLSAIIVTFWVTSIASICAEISILVVAGSMEVTNAATGMRKALPCGAPIAL